MNSSILTVNELTKKYYSKSVNLFNKKTSANKALDKVSFSLSPGLMVYWGQTEPEKVP